MSTWKGALDELGEIPPQIDYLRRKYLKQLFKLTGRNVIAYYSGFLEKPIDHSLNLDINDSDMEGFMSTVNGLDCSLGLDLILHTPGGDPTAAEAIVRYLKDKFDNDIRVIVPQLAMSAGTMIACSGKEILMGRQSSLGPIDPQFNGIPAYNIQQEFEDAKNDLAINPQNANFWAIRLGQYPAAFSKSAIDAIALSDELIQAWLSDNMCKGMCESDIKKISKKLTNHPESKVHGRHYNYIDCRSFGLKISLMEDNQELQDAILSIHHFFMITFSSTRAIKLISNNIGSELIRLNNPSK